MRDHISSAHWEAQVDRSRAGILNNLLLAATVGGLAALILNYFSLPRSMAPAERLADMALFIASWLVTAIVWVWKGPSRQVRATVLLIVIYGLALRMLYRGGLEGAGHMWLLFLPSMTFLIVGPRAGLGVTLVSLLTYIFFALAAYWGWLPGSAIGGTGLSRWINVGADFLLISLALLFTLRAFNHGWFVALEGASDLATELELRTEDLEQTSGRLHRQASQLKAATDVARVSSSILSPRKLMEETTSLIRQGASSLGVYYVGLFLLDEEGEVAELACATGEVGQLLEDLGYSVGVDESTIIGQSIQDQEASSETHLVGGSVQLDSVPMPHTRSRVALPLRSRGDVLGAMSLHSSKESAFEDEDIAAFQIMADQVAIALDNAQLLSRTERALQEVRATHRRYLAEAWSDFLASRKVNRVDFYQSDVEPEDAEFLREARSAAMVHERSIATGESPSSDGDGVGESALVVPLKLRGQVIGTMTLHDTEEKRPWDAQAVNFAETVAEQLMLTIENLRLMHETQRRAARERVLSDIFNRMERAVDMETLMRVTAEELKQVLDGTRAFVHLGTDSSSDGRE